MGVAVYAITALIIGPLVYFLYQVVAWILKIRSIGQAVEKYPGHQRSLLFGHLQEHPGANEECLLWFVRLTETHSRLMRFWWGPARPCVILWHPETAKVITKTAEPKAAAGGAYDLLKHWIGGGLLVNKGKLWARNRRLLTPAFHFEILKPYVKVYNQAADILLDQLQPSAEKGEPIEDVFKPVSLCTLDIILRCAFSYQDDIQQTGESHPYVKTVSRLGHLLMKRALRPWLYTDFIYKLTADGSEFFKLCKSSHDVSNHIIERRKKSLKDDPEQLKKRHLDFLDILLAARDEDGNGLADNEIRREVDTFLFAGHDTTASAISWTLYSLAKHPEYQEKARSEIDTVLLGRTDEDIEWEDLSRLDYLTMCIKESMRLNTPVPFISRQLTGDLQLDGHTLPKDAFIDVNIFSLHHNRAVWGNDHMEYKPERFSPENMKNMDSHAFIPFSAGPRNCIGQNFAMNELKIVIGRILRRYILEVEPTFKAKWLPEMVLRAEEGIRMTFVPRKTG